MYRPPAAAGAQPRCHAAPATDRQAHCETVSTHSPPAGSVSGSHHNTGAPAAAEKQQQHHSHTTHTVSSTQKALSLLTAQWGRLAAERGGQPLHCLQALSASTPAHSCVAPFCTCPGPSYRSRCLAPAHRGRHTNTVIPQTLKTDTPTCCGLLKRGCCIHIHACNACLTQRQQPVWFSLSLSRGSVAAGGR
jgi:hypothetical protein